MVVCVVFEGKALRPFRNLVFFLLIIGEIALTFNKFTNNVEKNRGRDGDRHPFQVM